MNNLSAFPVQSVYIEDQETNSRGMTLRDYFAAKSIGITAPNKTPAYDDKTIARYAYEIADAMLKAREQ